jgi:hypothetical protein
MAVAVTMAMAVATATAMAMAMATPTRAEQLSTLCGRTVWALLSPLQAEAAVSVLSAAAANRKARLSLVVLARPQQRSPISARCLKFSHRNK